MTSTSHLEAPTRPETVVHRLKARLANHALWDASFIFVPPLLASLCGVYFLVRGAWVSAPIGSGIALSTLGLGVFLITLRYRKRIPKLFQTAQLVDQRAGAKDHFLTLATIDQANCNEPLLSRLRRDTEELACQVDLKHDFRYKVKASTYGSVGSSLIALLLLYLLLLPAGALLHPEPTSQRLRQLADDLAQAPQLRGLSEQFKNLATKLEDPKVQPEEQQAAVQELKQKIEDQQKKTDPYHHHDLLSKAADELAGAEKQRSASGQKRQDNQSQGGGNIQSNLPKAGEGKGKQSQGGGADGQGKMSAQASKDLEQGNSAQGDPKQPGQEQIHPQQGDTKENQPDPNRPGKEPKEEQRDKNQGASKEGSGKNQASEEPPQSAPPAERFYQAGEGKNGLKGARYVTVRLPEDVAAISKAENKATREGTGRQGRAQVPVSNVPLPAQVPNTATEKQHIPIEYRGIIR